MSDNTTAKKPLLGIGSCLAGNAVRYDGRAKPPNGPVREICEQFDLRAFCPEMGIGLGVPRPPIHLVGSAQEVRLLDVATHCLDFTNSIRAYAQYVLEQVPMLCGYILVNGSPSCGYTEVKRFSDDGSYIASDQSGIFVASLQALDPQLPLEDDERLLDPARREGFVERALAYHKLKLQRLERPR